MHDELCKRCILREMDENAFENIYAYINSLPEEICVSKKEHERRVSICLSCSDFINGMCRLCGCFVEVRAIMKNKSCPGARNLW